MFVDIAPTKIPFITRVGSPTYDSWVVHHQAEVSMAAELWKVDLTRTLYPRKKGLVPWFMECHATLKEISASKMSSPLGDTTHHSLSTSLSTTLLLSSQSATACVRVSKSKRKPRQLWETVGDTFGKQAWQLKIQCFPHVFHIFSGLLQSTIGTWWTTFLEGTLVITFSLSI